jgi:hypothetical protein
MVDVHWAEAVDGLFASDDKWTGDVAPGISDIAVLDATGGDYTVTSTDPQEVSGLEIASNATLVISDNTFSDTGAFDNAGYISVGGGVLPTLSVGGTLNNSGSMFLGGTLSVRSAGAVFAGGGKVTLSANGAIKTPSEDETSIVNVDNTISGDRSDRGLLVHESGQRPNKRKHRQPSRLISAPAYPLTAVLLRPRALATCPYQAYFTTPASSITLRYLSLELGKMTRMAGE